MYKTIKQPILVDNQILIVNKEVKMTKKEYKDYLKTIPLIYYDKKRQGYYVSHNINIKGGKLL
tara:strand:- start:70 stop:258 length:189 start_codon:yes stop_codon:yes gene_type:complete